MKLMSVYITIPDQDTAKLIAHALLDKSLVACCNTHAVHSQYLWEGSIEAEDEFVLICKSLRNKWKSIKTLVKEMHPYDIPCILRKSEHCNSDYGDWVNAVLEEEDDKNS